MQEKILTCKCITPLFSCGAYTSNAEVRPSELKGMMRYVYRITCPSSMKALPADEKLLFGAAGAEGSKGNIAYASPLRLMIKLSNGYKLEEISVQQKLLLHKKEDNYRNRKIASIPQGTHCRIIIRLHPKLGKIAADKFENKIDIDWYTDLIKLTLILCGMGKRSRKGRGCLMPEEPLLQNKEEALLWICNTLNKIAAVSSEKIKQAYQLENNRISATAETQIFNSNPETKYRPVIQKIEFGTMIPNKKDVSQDGINRFLELVDYQCHKGKEALKMVNINNKNPDSQREIFHTALAVGNGYVKDGIRILSGKFASPLLISLIETKEGCYPIYTYVTPVVSMCKVNEKYLYDINIYQSKTDTNNSIILDPYCKYRDKFKMVIENRYKETFGQKQNKKTKEAVKE